MMSVTRGGQMLCMLSLLTLALITLKICRKWMGTSIHCPQSYTNLIHKPKLFSDSKGTKEDSGGMQQH